MNIVKIIFGFSLLTGIIDALHAQSAEELQIIFPQQNRWNIIKEGEHLQFALQAKGGLSQEYRFSVVADIKGVSFDSLGKFSWTPGYDIVTAEEEEKGISFIFEVTNKGGESTSRQVEIVVQQNDLFPKTLSKVFKVNPGEENQYQISIEGQDSSAVEFEPQADNLPEGLHFSQHGSVDWKPTEAQVEQLQGNPIAIKFTVKHKVYNEETEGVLNISLAKLPEPVQAAEPPLRLIFPNEPNWNVLHEGEAKRFKLAGRGGDEQNGYTFSILKGNLQGISFDTLGNFFWEPDFDLVDRLEESKRIEMIFEVKDQKGQSDSKKANFTVYHTNRFPIVKELPIFYVQYDVMNSMRLGGFDDAIYDEDGDPLVFKPILSQMPQGVTLSGNGELTWKPSRTQFNHLQDTPLSLPFIVEDQPYKAQTEGVIQIQASEVDSPPEISVVPNENNFVIKEDETLNLKFYLSDPNGEEDILTFDFVSENSGVPKSALVKHAPIQYEFVWTPGYDFFTEPGDTGSFDIVFYVMDQTNLRTEKRVTVTIHDAENLVEKDRLLYSQYRTSLVRVWELLEELKEKEKGLRKRYDKAKKGKRTRAITSASLGAVTGLSPVFLEGDDQKITSGVGGTASMTLGTLEASNVIGNAPSDMMEQLSFVVQKLNELQVQGDIFAAKYALPNSRRGNDFTADMKKLLELTNLKNLPKLGLDSNWENSKDSSDKNLKKTFKDFNPSEDYKVDQ